MPQLDPSSYASQLFWLALCFIPLYWLMASVVLPRISAVLKQREDVIESDLNAAKTMQEEAEDFTLSIDESLDKARSQSATLVKEAKDSVESDRTQKFEALDKELHVKINNADQQLNKQRQTALDNIDSIVTDLTPQVVSKLLNKPTLTLKKAE